MNIKLLVPPMCCYNCTHQMFWYQKHILPKFFFFFQHFHAAQLKSLTFTLLPFPFIIRTVHPFRLQMGPIKYNGPAKFSVGHSCWPLLPHAGVEFHASQTRAFICGLP